MDIEIVTPPSKTALDVLSLAEFKRHLRMVRTTADQDADLTTAIQDAFDKVAGIGGDLNRTVLPTTYRRYLKTFPGYECDGTSKPILLPYPPLISVDAITIEDGSSPENTLETDTYTVKSGLLIPEIHPVDTWPEVTTAPRAVSVTFTAGYADDVYPAKLKRLIKILAAHYYENLEATINEPRQMMVNRKVSFGLDDLIDSLRISPGYDNWGE